MASRNLYASSEKSQNSEVIRLLSQVDEHLKENNAILKQYHLVILDMAENVRKIKVNTQ
jgi:hypothetical protein